jgi:hypothetical protein
MAYFDYRHFRIDISGKQAQVRSRPNEKISAGKKLAIHNRPFSGLKWILIVYRTLMESFAICRSLHICSKGDNNAMDS